MRSYTTRTIGKWILGLVMICLMIGSGVLDVFADSYDDSVNVVLQYRQIYKADKSRTNDTFKYKIVPVDGAPVPDGSKGGVCYFSVKGEPGKTTQGDVKLSMTFPKPGEYKYKVSAYVPNPQKGFTYEKNTYTLHVYVTNNDNGGLEMATVTGEKGYKNGIVDLNVKYEAEKVPGTVVRPTTTPRGDGAAAPAANGAPAAPAEEVVEPEPEPTPIENIINDIVPKADPETDCWALLNLIAAIATVITSAILVVRYMERIDTEEDEYIIRRKGNIRLLGLIPAIASVITFVLTENMSLPMEITDEWTPFMIIALAVELVAAFAVYMKYDRESDDEEAAA